MNKVLALSLFASALLPVAAQAATSPAELRHDRQQVREERAELRNAQHYGSPRDIREERRDLGAARRELREDRHNTRDRWQAPFAYQRYAVGSHIDAYAYGPRYVIANPRAERLPAYGGRNLRWVRHYDDALLVNIRNGRVVKLIRHYYD